jgi:hypothetical protein
MPASEAQLTAHLTLSKARQQLAIQRVIHNCVGFKCSFQLPAFIKADGLQRCSKVQGSNSCLAEVRRVLPFDTLIRAYLISLTHGGGQCTPLVSFCKDAQPVPAAPVCPPPPPHTHTPPCNEPQACARPVVSLLPCGTLDQEIPIF